MGRGALAMWKSLVPRPTLAAGTSAMRGSEGRRLAPSATPWDDAGERSLGPAETLVMACHRDLHGCRHAGASPGGRRTSPTHASGTRARDVGPARPGATGGTGTTPGAGGAGPANAPAAWPPGPCPEPTAGLRPGGRGPRPRRPRARAWEGTAGSNRGSETTPPCWPARPLAVPAGTRGCVVLSGNVWIDEKYYPLSGRDQRRKADGTRPRGPSGNQIRVAIGRDGRGRSHSSRLGLGKPGEPGTRAAYAGHIQRGSHPARDMEGSHEALVREPGPTEEAHDPRRTRTLPDKENPLHEVNELCYLPGLFPSSHSGFDRARSGGCLDLFHVMMSPPDERMGKAACVPDRAMRFPYTLRCREHYRKKTSSKGTRSSWEPTTSKGGFKTYKDSRSIHTLVLKRT